MTVIREILQSNESTPVFPVLFLGHGSPMNAIEENEFVQGFRQVAQEIEVPKAILCISAHWQTRGTMVTAMSKPQTIHDFGGFPKALYEVEYPSPGHPELARETRALLTNTEVELDDKWGLDHGAWSVIKHMYPNADVPVVQLSLDYSKDAQYHYDLARQLFELRNKGVLVIGSGNIVHNLGLVAWDKLNEDNFGFDWAIEAKEQINSLILNDNHSALINYDKMGKAFQLSIPTPEHYLPLLYALALKKKGDEVTLFNNKSIGGSLSMTSVLIS